MELQLRVSTSSVFSHMISKLFGVKEAFMLKDTSSASERFFREKIFLLCVTEVYRLYLFLIYEKRCNLPHDTTD